MQISMQMRLANLRIQTGKWVLWGRRQRPLANMLGRVYPCQQLWALEEGMLGMRPRHRYLDSFK